jgi:hypothetical protein
MTREHCQGRIQPCGHAIVHDRIGMAIVVVRVADGNDRVAAQGGARRLVVISAVVASRPVVCFAVVRQSVRHAAGGRPEGTQQKQPERQEPRTFAPSHAGR